MSTSVTCPGCAARLRLPEGAAPMPKSLNCPKCKTPISLAGKESSRKRENDVPPLLAEGSGSSESGGGLLSRKWLLIGGGTAVVVAGVVAMVLLLGRGGGNLDNLMKVKSGMTEAEVVALIGQGEVGEQSAVPPGAPSLFGPSDRSREIKTMRWKGKQNGMDLETKLTFVDGKVLMGPGDLGAAAARDLGGLASSDPQKMLENAFGGLGGGHKKAPENMAQALEQLKSKDAGERRAAARWLAKAPLDPARQPDVAKSLEAAIGEKNSESAMLEALAVWGNAESVPVIAALL